MSEQINSVDFWVDELTKDIDPDHFGFHKRVIPYRDDEKISKYGSWMWNNGYNVGLYNLQTKVNTYCIPQWISVKDRLPENVRDVVVCDECGNVFSAYYTTDRWQYAFTIKPCIPKVAYWMPLPEPPESEGVDGIN